MLLKIFNTYAYKITLFRILQAQEFGLVSPDCFIHEMGLGKRPIIVGLLSDVFFMKSYSWARVHPAICMHIHRHICSRKNSVFKLVDCAVCHFVDQCSRFSVLLSLAFGIHGGVFNEAVCPRYNGMFFFPVYSSSCYHQDCLWTRNWPNIPE